MPALHAILNQSITSHTYSGHRVGLLAGSHVDQKCGESHPPVGGGKAKATVNPALHPNKTDSPREYIPKEN